MIHAHELNVKPANLHIYKVIEDEIWSRHCRGFNWINLPMASIPSDILEDLGACYKDVKFNKLAMELHLAW